MKMVQLVDIFSKPEMSLMAAVMDYFSLEYQPEILYYDVSNSIGAAHATFHLETSLYLDRDTLVGKANPGQQEGLPHC